jgi:uncharacterized protein YdaT
MWTSQQFKARHNKKLKPAAAKRAAKTANAVLERTGDEGRAIRIANAAAKKKRR